MRFLQTKRRAVFLSFALLAGACLGAAEWPEWRGGPARDGIWNEPDLPKTLPKAGPKTIWKHTIGSGFSAPSIAGGRLYVMDRLLPPAADRDTERVLCLDSDTGMELWVHAYPCELKLTKGYDNGPRSTPTVHQGKVYSLGAMGHLHCFDAVSGKVLWSIDLLAAYHARIPDWGLTGSPWMEDQMVIVQAGGRSNATVIAFDKETGKEIWRNLSDKAGYASIMAIHSGGRRQLIVWTGDALGSLDPKDGALFWRHPRRLKWDQAIATPIFHAGLNLLLISSDREGTLALQLDTDKPGYKIAWEKFSMSSLHGSSVQVGDYLYGLHHDGNLPQTCGEFRCVKVATGEVMWAATNVTRLGMWAQASVSFNEANQTFYLLNDGGELILAKATPKEYRELSRAQLTGKTWSFPSFANKRIYARNETSLICASLAE